MITPAKIKELRAAPSYLNVKDFSIQEALDTLDFLWKYVGRTK